eukprot:13224256-Alexandrium_andersonii.AAC.1
MPLLQARVASPIGLISTLLTILIKGALQGMPKPQVITMLLAVGWPGGLALGLSLTDGAELSEQLAERATKALVPKHVVAPAQARSQGIARLSKRAKMG